MNRKFDLNKLNSRQVPEDSYYERRALFKAMHFDDEDLNRPFIAVANSWNEFIPGHFHLRSISEAVKTGIWQAGGMPVEFNHIGACDGLAVDTSGNIWATGPGGVMVFTPDGKYLGSIETGTRVSNCCFGGVNGNELYITADMYLCRVKVNVTGIRF